MPAPQAKDSLAEVDAGGKFVRTAAGFRDFISPEHPVFKPEADRYHLYISLACPWANRCDAVRRLKGLEHIIGCTVVHPTWKRTRPDDAGDTHCGWFFHDSSTGEAVTSSTGHGVFVIPKCTPCPLGHKFIRDLYEASDDKLGKYSVPVLWDKQTGRIVNNESSEILRMINSQFNAFATNPSLDLTPAAHLAEIDAINAMVYENINDGVYRCGFAKTQQAYDSAVASLYTALDAVEELLSRQRYLVGAQLTEADIRLYMTLCRFDEVYVVYFKTNKRSIADYPNLSNYCRELYQMAGIGACTDIQHIKTHYFSSHPTLNPYAIVPAGPDAEAGFRKPHDRSRFD